MHNIIANESNLTPFETHFASGYMFPCDLNSVCDIKRLKTFRVLTRMDNFVLNNWFNNRYWSRAIRIVNHISKSHTLAIIHIIDVYIIRNFGDVITYKVTIVRFVSWISFFTHEVINSTHCIISTIPIDYRLIPREGPWYKNKFKVKKLKNAI